MSQKTFEDYLKATPAERRKMNMNEILGEERLANIRKQMLNEIKDTLQEDKELLLKDLCGRLPYGVNLHIEFYDLQGDGELASRDVKLTAGNICYCFDNSHWVNFKPYLRPMSSMTEEEKEELKQEHLKDERLFAECLTKAANGDDSMRGKVIPHFAADWCNKNHFDFRGLIPMGLALEALDDMYKQ